MPLQPFSTGFHDVCCLTYLRASLVTQLLKNLPAMQEIWVRSLDREDPLEKEIPNLVF